ncbi:hypothetical protein HMPREF0083_00271, partial [Aneurinibacillus aneurinilyticus ATCC 12856]
NFSIVFAFSLSVKIAILQNAQVRKRRVWASPNDSQRWGSILRQKQREN